MSYQVYTLLYLLTLLIQGKSTSLTDFQDELLKSFVKVFDYKQWPSSFYGLDKGRKFGIKEISNLGQLYFSREIITQDE